MADPENINIAVGIALLASVGVEILITIRVSKMTKVTSQALYKKNI